MARVAPTILLAPDHAAELNRLAALPNAISLRAKIILAAAGGANNLQIAKALHLMPITVSKWRRRFAAHGIAGLLDSLRSGRKAKLDSVKLDALVNLAGWFGSKTALISERQAASLMGVSRSRVQQIWHRRGLRYRMTPEHSRACDGRRDGAICGIHLDPAISFAAFRCNDPAWRWGLTLQRQPASPTLDLIAQTFITALLHAEAALRLNFHPDESRRPIKDLLIQANSQVPESETIYAIVQQKGNYHSDKYRLKGFDHNRFRIIQPGARESWISLIEQFLKAAQIDWQAALAHELAALTADIQKALATAILPPRQIRTRWLIPGEIKQDLLAD